jgi:tRNA A37 threonylcarbamoyladenosine modification protein TsaB
LKASTVLAFDTSAAHCAAALLCGDRLMARVEAMAKGQAERLVPMLDEMLAEEGLVWADIGLIAVGTGPGNFTGIRIAVSLARGLALGLGVPAIGVTGFEALGEGRLVALPAPRGQVYVKGPGVDVGIMEAAPEGALNLGALPVEVLVEGIARAARAKSGAAQPRPAPFYLRPADAAPASDPPPVILA